MIDILFRGKRIDNGEWVYGYFFTQVHFPKLATERECYYIKPFGGDSNSWSHFEIDPATVGQFTGLTDKNGQKIFEGDVVLKRTYIGKKPFPVTFGGGMFHCGFGVGSSTSLHRYSLEDKEIEVIGSIHDNPELMEGE